MEKDIKVGDWVVYDCNGNLETGIVVKIWKDEFGDMDSYVCFVPEKGKPYVLRYYLSSLEKITS